MKRTRGRPRAEHPLRETAKPFPLYLHPAFHKALKLRAVQLDKRMHDLLIDWIEAGARGAGMMEPVRAQSADRRPGAPGAADPVQLDIEDVPRVRRSPNRK
ncbi:MAG TPA: hypothetical protein VD995_34165 [Azospirillum sp.]|nr:hypothetical protein [Azospirillum sp.]